jgi:hypothetical protein
MLWSYVEDVIGFEAEDKKINCIHFVLPSNFELKLFKCILSSWASQIFHFIFWKIVLIRTASSTPQQWPLQVWFFITNYAGFISVRCAQTYPCRLDDRSAWKCSENEIEYMEDAVTSSTVSRGLHNNTLSASLSSLIDRITWKHTLASLVFQTYKCGYNRNCQCHVNFRTL